MRTRLLLFSILILITACQLKEREVDYQQVVANPEFYHRSVKQITDVIMHDIFSPPVASRIYAYSNIAAYEALVPSSPENVSLAGQLNGLEPLPQPEAGQEYCFPLASIEAMLAVGKAMLFSEEEMETFRQQLGTEMMQLGIPEQVVRRSSAYGNAVAQHILAWSAKDTYKESRSYPKYTITDDPAKWRPTPPDYMDGIEP
ncbi:MAG: phosphatidic acid phosphatase, partial [Saprospiraceae bacterium]